jgi:hypothetical protein
MVLRLAATLDLPLRERNGFLLSAGFAPRFGERALTSAELEQAFHAVRLMLDAHEPYPAFALDRYWNIVLWNRPLAAMLAEPFDGKTVVVTHHAPSSQSVHPRYARDLLTPAFASNLENLMDGDRAALWIHGHMHESFDYEVYGTRVICNPRGYAPNALNPDFRSDWIVEI